MSQTYGLELVHRIVSPDLRSKNDTLISLFHWLLTSKGFKCVGNGEQPNTSDKKSELLPAGWNNDQTVYTLRYVNESDGKIYLFKAIPVDNTVVVNIMRTSDNKVASTAFVTDDLIGEPRLDFNSVYLNVSAAENKFVSELLTPIDVPGTQAAATSRASDASRPSTGRDPYQYQAPDPDDPLAIPPRNPLMEPRQPMRPSWNDPDDPFNVGRSDLDPFGGVGRGGGMLMDPRGFLGRGSFPPPNNPGQLPRGAVPPGARFDPFGPGGGPLGPRGSRPRFAGPDADHLPPPGYDDMFS